MAYFGTTIYTVQPGDTLYNIARNHITTIENILKFNPNIVNPNRIYTGQRIVIPWSPPEAIIYTVRPGDSLYSIARKYGTFVRNLIMFNYLTPPYIIYPNQQLVVTPSLE
ncbi:LysM peptidoglycan-binding domain-containing protein [Clostridium sp. MSJ-11]|uniref:LysM peptidoglycan-binding domain-containing protein n=1 Tax=Clostridium mobile TaxID=2841512 RepID=A0ABS6EGR9_9CLOT|nr:LysM peptidoglycan-binding domain-containing protein [Clostridium mobile]MBU5484403.1 LysM peptidoglycan-binding domain-containing protein [Clostridium mobile]